MSKIKLTDGTGRWIKPVNDWEEGSYWDGNNHISRATGSQWEHEHLYKSAKGRYVLHTWSQWQGSRESYEQVDDETAHRWLVDNGHDDEVPAAALAALEV
jgi:hypothetical protein